MTNAEIIERLDGMSVLELVELQQELGARWHYLRVLLPEGAPEGVQLDEDRRAADVAVTMALTQQGAA